MKFLVRRDENDDILYQASRFVSLSLHDVVPLVLPQAIATVTAIYYWRHFCAVTGEYTLARIMTLHVAS